MRCILKKAYTLIGNVEKDHGGTKHTTGTITGLKIMEKAKLSLSIDCFPMQYFVWRLPYSIIDTVTEILLNGTLQ